MLGLGAKSIVAYLKQRPSRTQRRRRTVPPVARAMESCAEALSVRINARRPNQCLGQRATVYHLADASLLFSEHQNDVGSNQVQVGYSISQPANFGCREHTRFDGSTSPEVRCSSFRPCTSIPQSRSAASPRRQIQAARRHTSLPGMPSYSR
jgi:hypothetical protein